MTSSFELQIQKQSLVVAALMLELMGLPSLGAPMILELLISVATRMLGLLNWSKMQLMKSIQLWVM